MIRTAFLPNHIDRTNWSQIFTVTNIWLPVVSRICQQTGTAEAQHVRSGYPGSCAVFIVDETVVVKLFPPLFAADYDREKAVYERLAGHLSPIPRLLASGVYPDQIDWPYLIISFCPGKPIRSTYSALSPADFVRVGSHLGKMLRQLHQLTPPGQLSDSWQGWVAFLQANRERSLSHLRQTLPFPLSVTVELEQFLRQMETVWLQERPLHLLHADLTEDHLLLLQQEGEWHISALIDWADAEVGVSAYEWVPLWYSLCQQDREFLKAIFAAYDPQLTLDRRFEEELLTFTCLHAFGGEIITHVLKQAGKPDIRSLAELQSQLIP